MDAEIQNYLYAVALRRASCQVIGPFVAVFDDHSAERYRNVAVTAPDARPSASDVAALAGAYRARDRVPVVEFVGSVVPDVEPALRTAGFAVERRAPLMICLPGDDCDVPMPADIELDRPTTDVDLGATIGAQRAAFGAPDIAPTSDDVTRLRGMQAGGGLVVRAVHLPSGETVGAAVCVEPIADVSELAGVGVIETYRRRGIAGAMTAALSQGMHARGVTSVWLEPAGPNEQRIYERAGFRVVPGEKLTMALD